MNAGILYYLFPKLFKSKGKHEWKEATIKQVRVENGRLVGFEIVTPELLECKKCGERKLTIDL